MKITLPLLLLSVITLCEAQEKYLETIKVSDHVYVFKPIIDWTHGNCVAIIGEKSILIVDTFIQTNYAEEAIRRLKQISALPVQYIVNTHWHNDHVMGNYTFRQAYPNSLVIMQDSTHWYMNKIIKKAVETELDGIKQGNESVEKELAEGKRSNGSPLTGKLVDFWKLQLSEGVEYLKTYKGNKFVNGDITFDKNMTIDLGAEKINLIHAETNGHSEGDVMVWIADKRLLITGDIIVGPTPYATGDNISGMIESIQNVIDMNPLILIPGHGVIRYDMTYPILLKELFVTMQKKSEEAVAKKIPVKEAMESVAVPTDLKNTFTQGDEVKEMALHSWFTRWIVYNTYKTKGALPKK